MVIRKLRNFRPFKVLNLHNNSSCDAQRVERVKKKFDELHKNLDTVEKRPGDARIFGFEQYLDDADADYFKNCHFNYCDLKKIPKPSYTTLMVNKTWNEVGAMGSGAGWHRDSGMRTQHKTFFYLSDVGPDNGPFCIKDYDNYILSLLDNPRTRLREPLRFKMKPELVNQRMMIGKAGTSFSCCTNFIHRGLPVVDGERYMLTVYAFDGELPKHLRVNTT